MIHPSEQIIISVCRKHHMHQRLLLFKNPTKHVSIAKQEIMFRLREECGFSHAMIAKRLGLTRSAIQYGVKAYKKRFAQMELF